jgi:hypothetical protein
MWRHAIFGKLFLPFPIFHTRVIVTATQYLSRPPAFFSFLLFFSSSSDGRQLPGISVRVALDYDAEGRVAGTDLDNGPRLQFPKTGHAPSQHGIMHKSMEQPGKV